MENINVIFDTEALQGFIALRNGESLFTAQLATRYYNQLFRFPPEHWGKVRHEFGLDTFISDSHCPFEIHGWIEETQPSRTLHVFRFSLKNRHTN